MGSGRGNAHARSCAAIQMFQATERAASLRSRSLTEVLGESCGNGSGIRSGTQLRRRQSKYLLSSRERVFLEGRLAQVKRDLELAEKNFSEFASENGALNVPEQGKAMIAAAAGLDGQLIVAQTQLESLKQIYTDSTSARGPGSRG